MNKNGTKRVVISALIGASSAALCLYLPALLLLPAALGFVAAGWGVNCFAAALAASVAALLGVFWPDAASALMMAGLVVPSALMIAYTLRRRKPYRTCVAVSGGAVTLALYCILCLPSVLAGNDPFAAFRESMNLYLEAFESTMGAGDTAAAQMLKTWEENLPLLVPQVSTVTMLGMGLGAGFFDTVIAYRLARRTSAGAELRPMAPAYRWELSREFTLGAAVLLLGCGVVQWMAIKNYEAIVAALLCIVLLPFVLMGVCFLKFTRKMRKRGAGFVVLCALMAAMMLFSAGILSIFVALATLGLLDRIFRFRKRYAAYFPGGPSAGQPGARQSGAGQPEAGQDAGREAAPREQEKDGDEEQK